MKKNRIAKVSGGIEYAGMARMGLLHAEAQTFLDKYVKDDVFVLPPDLP